MADNMTTEEAREYINKKVSVSYDDIMKAFFKLLADGDNSMAEFVEKEPIMILIFPLILTAVWCEATKEMTKEMEDK